MTEKASRQGERKALVQLEPGGPRRDRSEGAGTHGAATTRGSSRKEARRRRNWEKARYACRRDGCCGGLCRPICPPPPTPKIRKQDGKCRRNANGLSC